MSLKMWLSPGHPLVIPGGIPGESQGIGANQGDPPGKIGLHPTGYLRVFACLARFAKIRRWAAGYVLFFFVGLKRKVLQID